MNYFLTLLGINATCLFSIYLYKYQKNVKRHIDQNDKMYKMILEIHKRVTL